jgi:hypothetical protein
MAVFLGFDGGGDVRSATHCGGGGCVVIMSSGYVQAYSRERCSWVGFGISRAMFCVWCCGLPAHSRLLGGRTHHAVTSVGTVAGCQMLNSLPPRPDIVVDTPPRGSTSATTCATPP